MLYTDTICFVMMRDATMNEELGNVYTVNVVNVIHCCLFYAVILRTADFCLQMQFNF